MTYASVMVYVDDHPVGEARLALAVRIADHFDARLLGVAGSAAGWPAVDPNTAGAMLGEMAALFQDIAETEIRTAEAAFWRGAGPKEGRVEWRGRIGFPCDVIGHALRAADILVLGRRDPGADPSHAVDPADVLMIAGRPLLIMPPDPRRGPLGEPAVVAWTDSREARRAVQGALPMLGAASRVHVVEFAPGEVIADAERRTADVADFLAGHGIIASAQAVPGDGSARSAQIMAFAEDCGAGLIVAGGYGHPRLREWVLGGVTHDLLASSPVCLLVSH